MYEKWCKDTVPRDKFGRYSVVLPFRNLLSFTNRGSSNHPHGLGDSRKNALKPRLHDFEIRPGIDRQLYEAYCQLTNEY